MILNRQGRGLHFPALGLRVCECCMGSCEFCLVDVTLRFGRIEGRLFKFCLQGQVSVKRVS